MENQWCRQIFKRIVCLNHLLPLSFSSVCKKFPRQSCHEVFSVADLGNPRHLQPSSTFHCEHCRDKYSIPICISVLSTSTNIHDRQLSYTQILYDNGQSVEVDGKLTQKLITGLQPETQYSFLLTNRGNSAGGLQHRVSTMTAPDILRTKPYLIGKTNSDGMVTVELPSVQTSEKVR